MNRPPEKKDAKAIFSAAVEYYVPDQWEGYIVNACGDDEALRQRVRELLDAHRHGDSFFDREERMTEGAPISERVGTQIGPYKLLQEIGEGGFGVVYMAEQVEPVRRKVALKIIKPGMDTKQVIARFEAERQALAMMDHPNIAKVLDAGATESGRPYFVMELVKGVPITEFCDANKLPTRDRLELFVTVCHAVQHAHQKGVIHRDLKPSNVMVTLHDNKPMPVIIDFGVSKAISHQLTEKTLFTAYGQMVGTPAYMSPEQAQMSRMDIDTRSDIYSLGVLAVRAAHRQHAAGRRAVAGHGLCGDAAIDPRGGGAQAFDAAQHAGQGAGRNCSGAGDGPEKAGPVPSRRSRLDRAQGIREGAQPALRYCQWIG